MQSAATSATPAEAYVREAFDRYGAGRRHCEALHGWGFGTAISRAQGSRRPAPLPDQQFRSEGFSRPDLRRAAAVSVCGAPRRWATGTSTALSCWSWAQRSRGEMAELRAAHPHVPFLVPGIGAQGGDLKAHSLRVWMRRAPDCCSALRAASFTPAAATAAASPCAAAELDNAAINFERTKTRVRAR